MFFSPKQATTSFRPHSYLNPLNLFRTTAPTVSSESPSPAEQSALRESNANASTPLHHRSPVFSRRTRYQAVANNNDDNNNNNNTDATHVNTTTNLRTNYRYVPPATPPRVLQTNSRAKTKGHHHHHHHHHHHRRHVNAGVRVQIQTNNALRKERSFRMMERHRSINYDTGTSTRSEFPTLAQEVKIAFASSEAPITYEEQVFYQELEKLGLDYVKVGTVMDPRRAEEVKAERENLLAMLENERMQFACVMKRKEEEKEEKKKKKKRVREREERVRLDKDKRKAKEEIQRKKKNKRSHEVRMHAEKEDKARLEGEEHRTREQERLPRLEAEKFVRLEEHRARVEEETQARLREEQRRVAMEREAERHRLMRESAEVAKIAAEQRAMQEAHARQAAEQAARRAHAETQAQLQARMDEMARLHLEARVQAMMDTRRRQEIEERFKAQEERLRTHLFEYVRFQAAFESHSFQAYRVVAEEEEAKARWYFSHAQQQNLNEGFNSYAEDILMRDPSYMTSVNGDVSMASIPDPLSEPTPAPLNHAPSPHPYIPPPQPNTIEEWFALYDSRWQEIRSLASSPPSSPESRSKPSLTFAHFPWPVFRFVTTLEDLNEKEIKLFFSKKYPHPRKLDRAWKEDLRRWHTDKLGLFVSRIRPEWVAEVEEGFLRCIRVMTVFQSETGLGPTTR